MITPRWAAIIAGSAACVVQITPSRLVSTSCRIVSSGMSFRCPDQPAPALLTRTSTPSKSRSAPATKPRASADFEMSTRLLVTLGEPSSRQCRATACTRSSRRAQRARRAPLPAKARALASPHGLAGLIDEHRLQLLDPGLVSAEVAHGQGPGPEGRPSATVADRSHDKGHDQQHRHHDDGYPEHLLHCQLNLPAAYLCAA